MHTTPVSLLERLRRPDEKAAWDQFVELYTPLLYSWTRRLGLPAHEAADLVQDLFTLLVQEMPRFQYDAKKSFHAWLRTVFLNKWRNYQRRPCTRRSPKLPAPFSQMSLLRNRRPLTKPNIVSVLSAGLSS